MSKAEYKVIVLEVMILSIIAGRSVGVIDKIYGDFDDKEDVKVLHLYCFQI